MITSENDLRITREQLGRVEAALLSLKETVKPNSVARFLLLAEGYVDQIEELRREIDDYLGVTAFSESRSELIISLEGQNLHPGEARGSLVAHYLDRFRTGLQSILETLLGVSDAGRTTGRRPLWLAALSDPTVLAMTPGSIKLHLGPPETEDLISGREEFRKGVGLILDGVEWASREEETPDIALASDPRVRKAILHAVQRLMPVQGGTVESIRFGGELAGRRVSTRLTRQAVPRLKQAMRPPGDTEEYKDVEGVIRELDLDNNTLYLRDRPDNLPALLCNFDETLEPDAIACLDTSVVLTGTLRTNAKNGAQTMDIETIESVDVPEEEKDGSAAADNGGVSPQ